MMCLGAAFLCGVATVPCHAQRTADGVTLYVTGQFEMGPLLWPRPFRLQIAARPDGTVELLLESVSRLRFPVPWLVTAEGQTMPEPARTRVILPPDSAHRMSTRLDSVMSYRVKGAAKPIEILQLDSIPGSHSLMSVEMHEVFEVKAPMRDTSVSVTFAGCMGWPETPVGWLNTGFKAPANTGDARRLSVALRDAAEWASRYQPRPPVDERTDISAAQAGCPARPIRGNAVPRFPRVLPSGPAPHRVHIDAIVDTAGRAEFVSTLFGDPDLARAARTALETWRFHPAVHASGRLARQRIHVEVLFTIQEPETQSEENALLAAAAAHGADILVIAIAPGHWRTSALPTPDRRRKSDGHDHAPGHQLVVSPRGYQVH